MQFIKIGEPFIDEMSGLAIVKMLAKEGLEYNDVKT